MNFNSLNRPKAKVGKAEIGLAPLIDIVFILLLFFMVTTVFPENRGINIEKPDSEHGGQLTKRQFVVLVDEHDQIYYKDNPINVKDLRRILADEFRLESNNLMLIKADRRTTTQALIKVMDAGKSAGVKQMGIATNDESDNP